MKTRAFISTIAMATLAIPALSHAQDKSDAELQTKIAKSIESGLSYLGKQQKSGGFWSSPDYPGLTALVLQTYIGAPEGKHRKDEAATKALSFLRSNAKPDGGIYTERMGVYNTSICLTALLKAGDPADKKLIDAAHRYLTGGQAKNSTNPASDGGFGYEIGDSGKGKGSRSDLDNTVFTLEALSLYRDMQRAQEKPVENDLNWNAAIDFVTRCQHLRSHNKEEWASDAPEEKGGFVYTPTGEGERGADKAQALRSYGTMTYAGLLSFIYADLKPTDPRVKAALEWASSHYTLEENPGQGAQGLYYYYHTMSKALTAANVKLLETKAGKSVPWRVELANKILSLQRPDGSWVSENGRWMEKDPNLVTSYCLLALEALHGGK